MNTHNVWRFQHRHLVRLGFFRVIGEESIVSNPWWSIWNWRKLSKQIWFVVVFTSRRVAISIKTIIKNQSIKNKQPEIEACKEMVSVAPQNHAAMLLARGHISSVRVPSDASDHRSKAEGGRSKMRKRFSLTNGHFLGLVHKSAVPNSRWWLNRYRSQRKHIGHPERELLECCPSGLWSFHCWSNGKKRRVGR